MLVSTQDAAGLLAPTGLAREQVRRLLLAGFAGPGQKIGRVTAYDMRRVRALRQWPVINHRDVSEMCPSGAFLLRAWRGIIVTASFEEQIAALKLTWRMSPWARVLIRTNIEEAGFYPFLLTVSGYVAMGANIRDLRLYEERETELVLEEPGVWMEHFHGKRFENGPAGPWMLWATRDWSATSKRHRRSALQQ